MQSTAPSHSGTRTWNKLKVQEDSLEQYAYDPQAVAAPMLVRSITCHLMEWLLRASLPLQVLT